MLVSYDPALVLLSIVLGMLGAYTCFELTAKVLTFHDTASKRLLTGAAFAIGGGIWSMHFVAMLALQLPIVIQYDFLLTLISVLSCVLMTGLALIIMTTGPDSTVKLYIAGIMMGAGISTMHYIGMSAVRGNCVIIYTLWLVVLSIVISIAASTIALWLALRLKNHWRKIIAAVVMGLAISGMHYTAMFASTFIRMDMLFELSTAVINPATLASIVSIATFLILGSVLLNIMPELDFSIADEIAQSMDHAMDNPDADLAAEKIATALNRIDKAVDILENIGEKKIAGFVASIVSGFKEECLNEPQ